MKVAFVTASVSRKAGGLEESLRRLAQALSSSVCVVEVFALHDEHIPGDQLHWGPAKVLRFAVRGPSRLGFAPGLIDALVRADATLTMSHGLWMYPSFAAYRWHAQSGRSYIVHPHGMLDPWALRNSCFKKRLAALLYEQRHLRHAACIRALCDSEARAIQAYGLKNPICIIPNGIDLPRGLPDSSVVCAGTWPSDRLKPSQRKFLLYLGRIHPKKGLLPLVRAWAQVYRSSGTKTKARDWVLVIAGWDQNGHEDEIKTLASESGLGWTDRFAELHSAHASPQIVFLGPRFGADKAECYRACDAVILPSFSEGMPMAVLEAWAYAKPVLMTPECNLPEGFAAGAAVPIRSGRAAPRQDSGGAAGIEDGLRELFGMSQAERAWMGQRGRALVVEKFSWNSVGEQMRAVIDWVAYGGPKPACVVG